MPGIDDAASSRVGERYRPSYIDRRSRGARRATEYVAYAPRPSEEQALRETELPAAAKQASPPERAIRFPLTISGRARS